MNFHYWIHSESQLFLWHFSTERKAGKVLVNDNAHGSLVFRGVHPSNILMMSDPQIHQCTSCTTVNSSKSGEAITPVQLLIGWSLTGSRGAGWGMIAMQLLLYEMRMVRMNIVRMKGKRCISSLHRLYLHFRTALMLRRVFLLALHIVYTCRIKIYNFC